MWFLPGLADERVGLFVRVHHVIADGVLGVATLRTLLDATPTASSGPAQPWTPAPSPPGRDLLLDDLRRRADKVGRALSLLAHPVSTLRHVKAAWPTMRWVLVKKPGPATSLDRLVGTGRILALMRSSLDPVKEIAHAHEAKVNDVLLAIIAGGLHGLLHSRGEPVDDLVLPIYVPVSLRRQRPGQEGGNLVSQMVIPLPIGVSDPGRRLRQIAAETVRRKARSHPSLGTLVPSGIAGRAILKLVVRRRVNLTSADLTGPRTPLYLAGARVLEVFPMLPLIGNVSLGVGALSYAGQLNIMVVADAVAYPDIDVFVAGVRHEQRALGISTSVGTVRQ
jgi:WS/DGAT/MGAT family acyltransferase